jgi:pyridoxal phosphate enzyme (YggS family)
MSMSSQPQEITALSRRLAGVQEEMAAAAARSGRDPRAIRLVAVTKTHPASVLQTAVEAGIREIGENYLQEAAEKFARLGWPEAGAGRAPVTRHAIGHLQSNKVRLALQWFDVIQTVDSLALARRIDRIAGEMGRSVPVLIEINISREPSKFGLFPEDVEGFLAATANLAHIQVTGLMTIGRFEPDVEAARGEFIAMRELRERMRRVAPPTVSLDELSMGMSHDFAVAIEEGATIVRVGSRLFGARA